MKSHVQLDLVSPFWINDDILIRVDNGMKFAVIVKVFLGALDVVGLSRGAYRTRKHPTDDGPMDICIGLT